MEGRGELLFNSRELIPLEGVVMQAVQGITNAFRKGSKLLVCGNGGSSSDSDHIVGELMKSFEMPRPLNAKVRQKLSVLYGSKGDILAENLQEGLPVISLSAHNALITAISNDLGSEYMFAQQVAGYGREGDVLLAISTSGNSENVCNALMTAKSIGMITMGLTGQSGGSMKALCDVLINVPDSRTATIQEYHVSIYHVICRMIESELFG